MAEEAKKHEFPGVSPWDVLIWKLDSVEKYVQREIGDLRQVMAELRNDLVIVKQDLATVRRESREQIENLRQELKGDIEGVRQELKQEITTVKQETAAIRQELKQEISDLAQDVRETRRSLTILEWTAVIGFLAIIATILAGKLM